MKFTFTVLVIMLSCENSRINFNVRILIINLFEAIFPFVVNHIRRMFQVSVSFCQIMTQEALWSGWGSSTHSVPFLWVARWFNRRILNTIMAHNLTTLLDAYSVLNRNNLWGLGIVEITFSIFLPKHVLVHAGKKSCFASWHSMYHYTLWYLFGFYNKNYNKILNKLKWPKGVNELLTHPIYYWKKMVLQLISNDFLFFIYLFVFVTFCFSLVFGDYLLHVIVHL